MTLNNQSIATSRSSSFLAALREVQQILQSFAQENGFEADRLASAFGTGLDVEQLQSWGDRLAQGDFSGLPAIASNQDLNGARGVYVAETNRIYLAESFLENASQEQLVAVLLEEIGHSIDAQINSTDSAGDEGAIFAAIAQGIELTEAQLAAFQQEDDRHTVVIEGETVVAEANTITVDTLTDVVDAGDGLTSLREALTSAVSGDTIIFDPSLSGSINLTAGELAITKAVTLDGDANGDGIGDITIDAQGNSRVFNINDNQNDGADEAVTLTHLTITGGNGFQNGGGISNQENLTLINSTIRGNSAATFYGGGLFNVGAIATVVGSTFSNNSGNGGAIANVGSTLTITNSTLSGNSSNGSSGGIDNYSSTTTITNSTITGNTAANNGGGIYNWNTGTLSIANSLISGNTASTGHELGNNGTISLSANNLIGHSGLTNTQALSGFNLAVSDITATSDGTQATALANILNPTLADNGGPTQTHFVIEGGPAVDAGNNGNLPTETSLGVDVNGDGSITNTAIAVDQTGSDRLRNSAVDIGAVEFVNRPPVITLPATASVNEDAVDSTIPGISIADNDSDNQTVTITVTNGTISLNGDAGLAFTTGDGNNDSSLAFSGTFADINTALNNLTFTPTADFDGTATIQIQSDDNISGSDTQTLNITVNNAPEVTSINRGDTTPTNATSVTFDVAFSDAVTGVDASDFALATTGTTTGTISSVTGSGNAYTVTVNGISGDGDLGLNLVDDGSITNSNTVALGGVGTTGTGDGSFAGQTYTLDNTAVISAPSLASDSGVSNSDLITNATQPTFSGTTEANANVELFQGGTSLGTTTADASGNWNFTVGSALSEGAHTITTQVTDVLGNVSAVSAGLAFTVDTTAPTVSLSTTAANPNNLSPIPVTITFSEAIDNFVVGDLVVSNGTATNLRTTDNVTFTAEIRPTVDGPVTVDLAANVAQDTAGNDNTVAVQLGTVSDRTTPAGVSVTPNLTLIGDSAVGTGRFTLTVTFDEDMNQTVNPTISFPTAGEDASSILTNGSGTWTNATTYVATYDVVDTNEELAAVDIQITGAQALAGHTYADITTTNAFDIDTDLAVTNLNDSGIGSLRQAILNANASGGGNILFDPSLSGGTITLSGTELGITTSLSIDGDLDNDGTPDITIDANQQSRVFKVESPAGAPITMDGLVITGGNADPGVPFAVFFPGADGGGIYLNSGALTVVNSIITGNRALDDGGGIWSYGNVANESSVTLLNSTITGNTAGGNGGALSNASFTSPNPPAANSAVINVVNSTLSGNTANVGGGIANLGQNSDNSAVVNVVNSTISGNAAVFGGGGIYNRGQTSTLGATINITNSTITQNEVTNPGSSAGGILNLNVGGSANTALVNVVNSIIAGNTATVHPDVRRASATNSPIVDGGNNLIGIDAQGIFTTSTLVGDATTPLDPRLDPLADNGGLTQTHALAFDSPGIDAGSNAAIPTEVSLGVDVDGDGSLENTAISVEQRGGDRISNTTVDIGAVESLPNTAPNFTGNALLAAVNEDAVQPVGNSITHLFGALFNDPDLGASFGGIAVVGNGANASTEGTWQYSTDGTAWFEIGIVADDATALALSALTSIRFVPAANYAGTPPALTVRALDNTQSTFTADNARATVDTSANGGTTAIAAATRSLATHVNAAPTVSSITSSSPNPTNATSVTFEVTFSEAVNNVDLADFVLSSTGTAAGTVAGISGSGSTYTVSLNGISGDGSISLDVVDNDSITNGNTVPLGGVGTSGAGEGSLTGQTITIDNTAPVVSLPSLDAASDTGLSNSDRLTTDTTPTFIGTAEANASVELFSGSTSLGTTTADISGNWSFTPGSALSSGNYTITAQATDASGNASATSTGLALMVDTTTPSVTSATPNLTLIGDSNIGTDRFTLTVVFDKDMDTTVNPTLSFPTPGEDASPILTNVSGSWTNVTTYVATYDVVDTNIEMAAVDLQISGAQDLAGNTQATFTAVNAIEIDTDLAVTNLNDSGLGSLRQAILNANASGGGTINFDPSLSGSINLTSGELAIRSSVTIDGDGNGDGTGDIAINAQGNSRVFNIDDGQNDGADETIALMNLTITGGNTTGAGGGIFSIENLTLTNSTVSNNTSNGWGGGFFNGGGANVTITNSTISGNSSIYGGGMINSGATVTIANSTISGNTSSGRGGGIQNHTATTLTLSNSTVSGNTASDFGGGLANSGSTVIVSNSTVSGNSANGFGGGIANFFGSNLTLSNTLVVGNDADADGNGSGAGDEISNSATIAADGHNLFGHSGLTNAQAFDRFTPVASDITATSDGTQATALTNILDTTLANNGGPTQTHALVFNSPAVDAGNNVNLPTEASLGVDVDGDGSVENTAISVDQIGANRPFGPTVDIGAAELQNALPIISLPASLTVAEDATDQVIAGISIADSDNDNQTVTITVTNGTISLNGTAGLAFTTGDGTHDSSLAFSGSVADINTALNNLRLTAPADFNGPASIRIQTADGISGTDDQTLNFNVDPVNDRPTLANAIANQPATEDAAFSFTVPANTFDDVDTGDTRAYTVTLADDSPLPSWLTFDANSQTFSGTPLNDDVGTISVKVTQTDSGNASVSSTFNVAVANTNDAPILTGNATLAAISEDTTNPAGEAIATFFTPRFSDVDAGASLSGVAVVGNPANPTTEGTWQYSTDGTAWHDIGAVSDDATALVLSAATTVRFVPVANYNGSPAPLSVRAIDNSYSLGVTDGATRVTVDSSVNGGTAAIASTLNTLGTTITAVSDTEFVVTNTNDSGPGSLRQAILYSNDDPAVQTIRFAIPGNGPHSIALSTALPAISNPVILDGYSQAIASENTLAMGNDAVLQIALDGSGLTSGNGLSLVAGAEGSTVQGLAIQNFPELGIYINSTNNSIRGNFIGTDVSGTQAQGNANGIYVYSSNNVIGGSAAGDRNLISGNNTAGLLFIGTSANNNQILGNYIGTQADGASALGNGQVGIGLANFTTGNQVGGSAPGAGNLSAHNGTDGIAAFSGSDALIQGNTVFSNSRLGILANGSNHQILDNTVHGNGDVGIATDAATSGSIPILRNSIYNNGGLGIDLEYDGITANDINDVDTGNNGLQNFPVLDFAELVDGDLIVTGNLNSIASQLFHLEFFLNDALDASGHGEGRTYLGFWYVMTDTTHITSFNANLGQLASLGQFITATVTNQTTNETSEFSLGIEILAPTVTITPVTLTQAEATGINTDYSFTVTLSQPSSEAITVDYQTNNGTAVASTDYIDNDGTLTFAPGETSKTITISAIGDSLDEPDESFTVQLTGTNASGGISGNDTVTATITDNDNPPNLSIGDINVNEADSTVTLTVSLDSPSGKTITVDYTTADDSALAGPDYIATANTLTFAPGETQQTILVPILNDIIAEAIESFTVTLSNAVNAALAQATAKVTVADDDAASLSIADATIIEGNGGTTQLIFDVTLTGEVDTGLSVDFATADIAALAGTDYTAQTGTLTFEGKDGEVQQIIIEIQPDSEVEPDEMLSVTLSNLQASGRKIAIAQAIALGSIINDDKATAFINDITLSEGDEGTTDFNFTVALDQIVSEDVSLIINTRDLTSIAGEDYEALTDQSITISAGQLLTLVTVRGLGDIAAETDEQFEVNLSNAQVAGVTDANQIEIADAQGIATLLNDDPTQLSFSLLQGRTNTVNEIIFVATDGQGRINGLTPNDAGFSDALLNNAQVIFSTLPQNSFRELEINRILTVNDNQTFQFARIEAGSLDSLRNGGTGMLQLLSNGDIAGDAPISARTLQTQRNLTLRPSAVQSPTSQSPDGSDEVIFSIDNSVSDIPTGSALQGSGPETELLDFRELTGTTTATFEVYRESAFDNIVGFYFVENEQGQVRDEFGNILNPGDIGYVQAAIENRLNSLELSTDDEQKSTFTSEIELGKLLSPFIVINDTIDALLDIDPSNDPTVYFAHLGANTDRVDHVRLLGQNTFGFEDLPGGGDLDFDDIVVKATFV